MTTEAAPANAAARPTPTQDSKGLKGKHPGAAGNGQGGAGGFTAVMVALGASEASGPITTELRSPLSAGSKLLPNAMGTGKLIALKDGDGMVDLSAFSESDAADLPVSADASATTISDLLGLTNVPVATEVPLDASLLMAQSAQALVTAPEAAGIEVRGLSGGFVANPFDLTSHTGPASGKNMATTAAELATAPWLASKHDAKRLQADVTARLAQVGAMVSNAAGAQGQSDGHALPVSQKIMDSQLAPLAALAAIATATTSVRSAEQTRERSVFKKNDSEGLLIPQAQVTGSASNAFTNMGDVSTPTEVYLAEKVSYWMSNDVQNAELKLDGMGDKPVEVSIRMLGNEAHVSFRTDELQARTALENATLHLKDLLQREGLVLTGVSVGTAGAGDPGEQGRKFRQGERQSTMVSSAQSIQTELRPISSRTAGGALDLFV